MQPPVYDDGRYEPQDWEASDLSTIRCDNPDELIPPAFPFVSVAAEAWERGILPGPGTLNDQPAKLISGIRLWRNMVDRAERLKMKRQQHAGGL